jgi:hypothetical protein
MILEVENFRLSVKLSQKRKGEKAISRSEYSACEKKNSQIIGTCEVATE